MNDANIKLDEETAERIATTRIMLLESFADSFLKENPGIRADQIELVEETQENPYKVVWYFRKKTEAQNHD